MAVRFFEHANYDFVSRRRPIWYMVAAVVAFAIIPGLIWQMTSGSWFNMGVDFTGGTVVQVRFDDAGVSVGDLRSALEPVVPGAEIVRFGGESEFLVRAPRFEEGSTNISDVVSGTLRANFPEGSFQIVRTEAVGPKVGSELKQRAIIAIVLSFAITLIYLAFRLEWAYGVASIAATVHDIVFSIGLISALRLEVSLTTVAALLTIIGYSMNDKIVVFDRIRENVKGHTRRDGFPALVNRSINETLPRTVMTGGSVLAVLLVLFLLGGVSIRDFALIMFMGIVVGTYSSIWIGPAVLLEISERRPVVPEAKPRATPGKARASV